MSQIPVEAEKKLTSIAQAIMTFIDFDEDETLTLTIKTDCFDLVKTNKSGAETNVKLKTLAYNRNFNTFRNVLKEYGINEINMSVILSIQQTWGKNNKWITTVVKHNEVKSEQTDKVQPCLNALAHSLMNELKDKLSVDGKRISSRFTILSSNKEVDISDEKVYLFFSNFYNSDNHITKLRNNLSSEAFEIIQKISTCLDKEFFNSENKLLIEINHVPLLTESDISTVWVMTLEFQGMKTSFWFKCFNDVFYPIDGNEDDLSIKTITDALKARDSYEYSKRDIIEFVQSECINNLEGDYVLTCLNGVVSLYAQVGDVKTQVYIKPKKINTLLELVNQFNEQLDSDNRDWVLPIK